MIHMASRIVGVQSFLFVFVMIHVSAFYAIGSNADSSDHFGFSAPVLTLTMAAPQEFIVKNPKKPSAKKATSRWSGANRRGEKNSSFRTKASKNARARRTDDKRPGFKTGDVIVPTDFNGDLRDLPRSVQTGRSPSSHRIKSEIETPWLGTRTTLAQAEEWPKEPPSPDIPLAPM